MENLKKAIWQILLVSLWINIFETLRWMLFARPDIDMHFKAANLVLPNEPINNILWLIWGIIIAVMIFISFEKIQSIANNFYCVDNSVCYALDSFMEYGCITNQYFIASCSINFYQCTCWCVNQQVFSK